MYMARRDMCMSGRGMYRHEGDIYVSQRYIHVHV